MKDDDEPTVSLMNKRVINIDGEENEIICEFLSLPKFDWETAYQAYIIEHNGEKRLVYTDHGKLVLVDNDIKEVKTIDGERKKLEKDQLWLSKQIRQYECIIGSFQKALDELKTK